jgi:hypothetical protein
MQGSSLSFRAPIRVVAAAAALLLFAPVMAAAPGAHALQSIPGPVPREFLSGVASLAAGLVATQIDDLPALTFDELADRCDVESTRTAGARACRAAAFEYLTTKGLSNRHAAGVVGNLWVESNGVSPKSRQFGGGPGRGIAQWTVNERWLGLLAMARARGVDPETLRVQLDFLWHELTSSYRSALVALESAPTVRDATVAFQNKYEVPVGTAIGAPPFTVNVHPKAHTADRVQRAVEVNAVWARSVSGWPRLNTPPLTTRSTR